MEICHLPRTRKMQSRKYFINLKLRICSWNFQDISRHFLIKLMTLMEKIKIGHISNCLLIYNMVTIQSLLMKTWQPKCSVVQENITSFQRLFLCIEFYL